MATKLTGEALDKRVEELGIDDNLSADEKRAKIDEIEAATAEGKARAEAVEADPDTQSFSVQDILDRPRLLGRRYRRFEVAGAYHGSDLSAQVTLKDARQRVEDWANGEEAKH